MAGEHDAGVSLPEDIIFEVLARLPAKRLCRIRCVCKAWRTLISNPAFVAAQRSHDGPHLVGVFLSHGCPLEVRVMDMDGNVISAFGEMRRSTPQLSRLDLIYFDGKQLSQQCGLVIDPAAGRAFVAAFSDSHVPDRLRFTSYISFGRAAPSGVLKAVHIQEPFLWNQDGSCDDLFCEVATMMDSGITKPPTWRRRSAPPFIIGSRYDDKVTANGVLYCLSRWLNDDGDEDTALRWGRIAAFDLESEEWKAEVIHGPRLVRYKAEEMWCVGLVEIKGTLAMVHIREYVSQDVDIWLLVGPDKSAWVKDCTIQMPKNHLWSTKLLGVLGDGRILLQVRRVEKQTRQDEPNYRDAVVFYNPNTKAFIDLWSSQEHSEVLWYFYTGSLLS